MAKPVAPLEILAVMIVVPIFFCCSVTEVPFCWLFWLQHLETRICACGPGRARVAGADAASGSHCDEGGQETAIPDGLKMFIPIAACGACGSIEHLRRCRHCRSVAYCSSACRKAHGSAHAEIHAMRFLHLTQRLSFRCDDDFERLNV